MAFCGCLGANMDQPFESTSLLTVAGIILAIFYLSLTVRLLPALRRLYSSIVAKIREFQALDRVDVLTLLIDAGLDHKEALRFYNAFYANAAYWERCLIKLFIEKHCFPKSATRRHC